MAPGYTLFDIQRWGDRPSRRTSPRDALVVVDEEGEVVWYHGTALGAGDARMTDDGTLINLYAPFGFKELDLLGQRVQAWTWGEPDSEPPAGHDRSSTPPTTSWSASTTRSRPSPTATSSPSAATSST